MDRSIREPDLRGRTLGTVMKDREEDLALFIEMRKCEKERNSLLLHKSDEIDQPLETHTGCSPTFKIVPSAVRKTGLDDFLNLDNEKNDYDWLLTPPGTPLFPSLENEYHRYSERHLATPKGHSTLLKSRLANPPDLSLRSTATASRQVNPSCLSNSTLLGLWRPSSSGGSSITSTRPSTPTGRPSMPTVSKPSRSSTPARSTIQLKPAVPSTRSSTPVRSSTPSPRSSIHAASKPLSRSTTPTRRPSTPSYIPTTSVLPGRSSSVTRSTPTTTITRQSSMISISRSGPTASKVVVPTRGTSPTVKSRPWKPSEMPGFSLDAPPNLRTSLPERPPSASRGRPGAPNSHSSSVESGPAARLRRKSCSPSRGRAPNKNVIGCGSVPAMGRSGMNGNDSESPVVIGTKMVERVINLRRLAPPKHDDLHLSNNSSGKSSVSPDSTGFGRTISKKSIDMALRHMDIRRSIPNSLLPLMNNIPASSMYSVRSGSARSRAVSTSDSPLATSSDASSEQNQ